MSMHYGGLGGVDSLTNKHFVMQHLNEHTEAKRWQGKRLSSLVALVASSDLLLPSNALSSSALSSAILGKQMLAGLSMNEAKLT